MAILEILLQNLIGGLLIGSVHGMAAIGLNMIFGVMGIVNVAHGAFILTGMYATYWIWKILGVNPFLATLATAAILFLLGIISYFLTVKRIIESKLRAEKIEILSLTITFSAGLFITNLILALWGTNYRKITNPFEGQTIPLGSDVFISLSRFSIAIIAITVIILLSLFLKRTRLGMAIRASSQCKELAELVGVRTHRINMIGFGIGVCLAGVAGALLGQIFAFNPPVGMELTYLAFIIVVLGGMGSIKGAFIGSLLIFGITGIVDAFVPILWGNLVQFILAFIILLIRPMGLFGKK